MNRINKQFIRQWSGLGLILISLLFIPIMAIVPFTQLSVHHKAFIVSLLAVGGQILTWIGIFLAGKELVDRYKKKYGILNWFKKKDKQKEE